MNKTLDHVFHAFLLTCALCFVMVQFMGQSKERACSRSVLIGSIALAYMVLFGHSFPPGKLNSDLGF